MDAWTPREESSLVDHEEFSRWRDEAGRALESARVQTRAGLHNWACFAAEQSAQLAIKGLLHGLGTGPWGHDLVKLGGAVRKAAGAAWPEELDSVLRSLSRHYIPARYPDAYAWGPPGAHYGPEDAREAITQAERVLESVDRLWRALSAA